MNVLASAFIEYLKDNVVLTVVLGIILLLIVALIIVMIVLAAKGKKTEETPAEPAAEENAEPVEAEAEPKEEPVAKDEAPAKEEPKAEEKPAETKKAETKKEETKKEETKATPAPAKKEETKKEEPKAAPAPAKEKVSAVNGKWTIYKSGEKFAFDLIASNGEVMLTSGAPYATLASAKSGITTYKNNIAKPDCVQIEETKSGDFFVRILNARGTLLATSSNYKTRSSAESAAESIKRWAATAVIDVDVEE